MRVCLHALKIKLRIRWIIDRAFIVIVCMGLCHGTVFVSDTNRVRLFYMQISVTCTLLVIHHGCLTQNYINFVDFEVLRLLTLKMTVVLGVTTYS